MLLLLLLSCSVVSDSVRPQRRQPTRLCRPWDSPGKNTGVGCHFLLQCRKVKSEREVAQSCLTPSDPMDWSPPDFSIHGIFQARVLEWGAIAFSSHGVILLPDPQGLLLSSPWLSITAKGWSTWDSQGLNRRSPWGPGNRMTPWPGGWPICKDSFWGIASWQETFLGMVCPVLVRSLLSQGLLRRPNSPGSVSGQVPGLETRNVMRWVICRGGVHRGKSPSQSKWVETKQGSSVPGHQAESRNKLQSWGRLSHLAG